MSIVRQTPFLAFALVVIPATLLLGSVPGFVFMLGIQLCGPG